MKKLSLLVALALLITVGGVYATWIYPSGVVTQADAMISHSLAGVSSDLSVGTFSESGAVTLQVDQKNPAYQGELLATGSITFTFVPAGGVSSDITNNGLEAEIWFFDGDPAVNTYSTFGEIYTVDSTAIPVHPTNSTEGGLKWTKNAGEFTVVVDTAMVLDKITFNENITLPTYDDYLDFHDAEQKVSLNVGIRQKTTP